MKLHPLVALLPFLFVSCAQDSLTSDTVSRGEAGRAQNVRTGTILSIRPVNIKGSGTGGTLVGAGVGGLGSNQIGGSRAGQAINRRNGIEIEVRLDDGRRRVSVVQEVSPHERFSVGNRVRVITGAGGRTRVTR